MVFLFLGSEFMGGRWDKRKYRDLGKLKIMLILGCGNFYIEKVVGVKVKVNFFFRMFLCVLKCNLSE